MTILLQYENGDIFVTNEQNSPTTNRHISAAHRAVQELGYARVNEDAQGWTTYRSEEEDCQCVTIEGLAVDTSYCTIHFHPDDDPVCVCGVHRSEHTLCGCEQFERRKNVNDSLPDFDEPGYLGYTGDGFTHQADEDAAEQDAIAEGR